MVGRNNLGANIVINRKLRDDELLFGEMQSAFVVTVSESDLMKIEEISAEFQTSSEALGRVGGDSLKINTYFDIPIDELKSRYESVIPKQMERRLK